MKRLLIFCDMLSGHEIHRWESGVVPAVNDVFIFQGNRRVIASREWDTTEGTFGVTVTLRCGFPLKK